MERVASTDGVSLAVHDLAGEGPNLLCSHATGFHGRVWAPIARRLADRHHCVTFDYRGHGDSTRPGGDHVDWRSYGHDCAAVVQALGLQGAYGLGHSKGGAALLMCELAHPGTFRALVVYEPVIYPPVEEPPRIDLADATRRRRTTFASYDEALANFSAKPPMSLCDPEALEAYVRHGFAEQPDGSVVLKCHPEHEARTYEGSMRHTLYHDLGGVACPVLVLAGSTEQDGVARIAADIAARVPRGELRQFPRLGHFGPLQDPAAIAEVAAEFFAAH